MEFYEYIICHVLLMHLFRVYTDPDVINNIVVARQTNHSCIAMIRRKVPICLDSRG